MLVSLSKKSRAKAISRTTHGTPRLVLLHLSHPTKPMPPNHRTPAHPFLRIRKPGDLVNQPLTRLNQKGDAMAKSRKCMQGRLQAPYHYMLVLSIKTPTASSLTAVPFPIMLAMRQVLRHYSIPSPTTSLDIQTRKPLM